MDADRFDTLAKRLVTPTTRRATLGAAMGGVLSALGLSRAAPAARAAQDGACELAFVATVRQGPSGDQVLTPSGVRPGELRGELQFSLSETGNLEDGILRLPDGARLPVVGQATGHALQVRIELAPRVALVAVGVGEQEIAVCQGAIDGLATGPDIGDLGDWHAAALRRTAASGGTAATGRTGSTTPPSNAGATGATGATAAASLSTGATGATGATRGSPTPTPAASGMADLPPPAGPTGSAAPSPDTDTGTEMAQCASGLSRCDAVCVDLQTDPANCGVCGTDCGILQCISGVCCPAGSDPCGGVCVDLFADPANCGTCGNACAAGQICAQRGTCVDTLLCDAGFTPCGSVCADLTIDAARCGACDNACTAEQLCKAGVCEDKIDKSGDPLVCDAGLTLCNKQCADVQSDPAHCGRCDAPCGNDEVCQGGICRGLVAETEPGILLNCTAIGLSPCGDLCVDLKSDRANCGSCGNVCAEAENCLSGICGGIADQQPDVLVTCAALGLGDCGGGVCVDLNTDHNNCGACGHACYPGLCNNGNGTCTICTEDVVAAGYCADNP